MTTHDAPLGRFFEDFVVGDVFRHPLGRTITETDNVWFTLLTMNTNPMHLDQRYAAASEFGRTLVNSALTLAIVTGQSVIDTSQLAFANLGWDQIRLSNPVFVGDILYSESEVIELRESGSRPEGGIVTIRTRGLNQDGIEVIRFQRTFLVYRRGSAQASVPFPEPADPW